MITIICEQPQEKTLNRLVDIFKKIKEETKTEISLKVAKSPDLLRYYIPKNNECLIVFGTKLYQSLIKDINKFDDMFGNQRRDCHKFSYFIYKEPITYFLACMPPIDFTMRKAETFLAFESMLNSLKVATNNFKTDLRQVYMNKKGDKKPFTSKIDVVENGFSPRVKIYMTYDDVKAALYSLFDLPPWTRIAIDTETNGLEIWDKRKHDINIISWAHEHNMGHAINLGLPGLPSPFTKEQKEEIHGLVEKFIFEKQKIFIAWKCEFDIFSICNKYNRTFIDFIKNNKIVDGIQMLHAFSENRKIEGYGIKSASRDFLNYAQYSYIHRYLDYLKNWQTYNPNQIIEVATNSLKYAAEDAAGEFDLTTMIENELNDDEFVKVFKDQVSTRVLYSMLEIISNGVNLDTDSLSKNAFAHESWERDRIIYPAIKNCESSTDKRCHTDMFIFSSVSGRIYYGKPFLNALKPKTELAQYFIADENCSLVYVDLNQAELRMGALISQDKNLLRDLENADFYKNLAKRILNIKEELITDEDREIAKQIALSTLNLAGAETVSREAGISKSEAKSFILSFYEQYPNMKKLKGSIEKFIKDNGFIFSASFRKRRFEEDDLTEDNIYKSVLSAHNHPFQATTSDMMLINCFKFIGETRKYGVKMIWFNHDAAVFNVPDSYLNEVEEKCCIFEQVPDVIKEGVARFNSLVLNNATIDIQVPTFSYKKFIGKNLKDVERFEQCQYTCLNAQNVKTTLKKT